ncbi:MAG: TerB family tellurite resistance protein [Bacteroidetes bacterium]|jgi:hypothetical protein|nr:TerB family tellurite resistance protein [Bacteroidota bacterium]
MTRSISVLDGSSYFKGLLLLLRKDNKMSTPEVDLVLRVGQSLGFEREFCENAVREILENEHIVDAPPKFSSPELAAKFIKDGLRIASADNELHPSELQWLWQTAEHNGLDPASIQSDLASLVSEGGVKRLDVEDLRVEF